MVSEVRPSPPAPPPPSSSPPQAATPKASAVRRQLVAAAERTRKLSLLKDAIRKRCGIVRLPSEGAQCPIRPRPLTLREAARTCHGLRRRIQAPRFPGRYG